MSAIVARGEPDRHRCGSCTVCCTVMHVAMDPPKPEHVPCSHCTGQGCGIYANRPEVCRGFECLWLATQKVCEVALPLAMRPDRCGVAIDLNAAGTIIAHCERPASWKREPMRSWLLDYAGRTAVVLETPMGAELLRPSGETARLVKVGVHESGNRLYAIESELEAARQSAAVVP